MKQIIAVLALIVLILPCMGAYATQIPQYPFANPNEDRSDDSSNFPPKNDVQDAINLNIFGESLSLSFDPSPEYSNVQNGMVQASFYAYSTTQYDYLYELYLIFPQNVTAGTVVTPEYAMNAAPDSSVIFIVSTTASEQYYFAAQLGSDRYPQESAYSIRFDEVAQADGNYIYSGSLTATVVEVDPYSGRSLSSLQIVEAPFHFTLSADAQGQTPLAPTVPPDLRTVGISRN